jgi:ABC-type spermidine/putrescine transport system permease subunit II
MWEVIRVEFTPVVAVASMFMIAIAMVLFVAARLFGTRQAGETR